ncbi:MAG: PepSY domain-containing protein [Gammaproteobacteria bacterium]|nr:PepSY domain-containing protein [Gammaproteobacteria bacterium]
MLLGHRVWVAVGLALVVAGRGSQAEEYDHNAARQALEAGEVLPLATILQKLQADSPKQIIEVELERKAQGWVYEIEELDKEGVLLKLEVDASSGEVMTLRRKGEKRNATGGKP